MLQVARLAPSLLQDASSPVAEYFLSQFNDDGAAMDRAGQSDLYYTVFALEGLIALQRDFPPHVQRFLESLGDGDDLDLVHLCCLARCWAALKRPAPDLATRIEALWDRDNVYHSFLAWGALQDLGRTLAPFPVQDTSPARTTPTTAATVTLLRQMQSPVPANTVQWLLARAHPEGGFCASEAAPMPDLLSTATALHALSGQKVSVAHLKEQTLDFLDTLWTGKAFCGTWADDEPDCEYTYYGLLAMGHLSLA
jgi:prenyltransferase beta subunit